MISWIISIALLIVALVCGNVTVTSGGYIWLMTTVIACSVAGSVIVGMRVLGAVHVAERLFAAPYVCIMGWLLLDAITRV